MRPSSRSPLSVRLSWGHLEVEGRGSFKDAKLFPGGSSEWDWRETVSDHVPGSQPADVYHSIIRDEWAREHGGG